MWRYIVEETRKRRTAEKVASARKQDNVGKCGKEFHKFKGHEDGKMDGTSRKEVRGQKC